MTRRKAWLPIVLLLTATAALSARNDERPRDACRVKMPVIGDVTFRARLTPDAVVFAGTARGRTVFTRKLRVPDLDHRSVRIRDYRLAGMPAPLILLVVDGPAADGVWIDASLYGDRNGRIATMLDLSAIRHIQDGLCIGKLNASSEAGIAVGEQLVGNEAAMAPHRYRATLFTWKDGAFSKTATVETRQAYHAFEDAQRELGLQCKDRLTAIVLGK